MKLTSQEREYIALFLSKKTEELTRQRDGEIRRLKATFPRGGGKDAAIAACYVECLRLLAAARVQIYTETYKTTGKRLEQADIEEIVEEIASMVQASCQSIVQQTGRMHIGIQEELDSIAIVAKRDLIIEQKKPEPVVEKVAIPPSAPDPNELDELLSIYRRGVFDRDVVQFSTAVSEEGNPLSLLMIDLDKFRTVNDTHGHPIGDEVLVECSGLVRKRVGGKGMIYRYGGEEISVLLPNFTTAEAVSVAETVRELVEKSSVSSKGLNITVSIGVASVPDHASNATDLIKAADVALYQAKKLGRNLVRVSGEIEEVPRREPQRRQPQAGNLSDEELEEIRRTYFLGYVPQCPKDGARLEVLENRVIGWRTPGLFINCPLCGLDAEIPGIPNKT